MTHDPALPPPFTERFAALDEVKFGGPRSTFHNCFGCGPRHDTGLRVRTFSGNGEVLAPILIPRRFEGPPGSAHGGIVAAYLDEVLAGAAVNHTGRLYVTGELTVRYVTGTPIERPLLGRGRAVLDSGKYLDLEATIEDWETGEVVAKATGRFFPVKET
ncbi:MAG TPA: PaaI family thioesterase [Candidatus Limnocylindria bacterium]|nr:PaaI family thioesterase [Candidatus Limnocylindria bacterium]